MCRIADDLLKCARNDGQFFKGESVAWRVTERWVAYIYGVAPAHTEYGLQAQYNGNWVCFSTNNHNEMEIGSRTGEEGILWFLEQVRDGLRSRIRERVRAHDQAAAEQDRRDKAAIPKALELLALLEKESLQKTILIRAV